MKRTGIRKIGALLAAASAATLLAGCHIDMWVQPKVKPQSEAAFFPDGQGERPPVTGTVYRSEPYNQLWASNPSINGGLPTDNGADYPRTNDPLFSGISGGKYVTRIPDAVVRSFPSFKAMLERGQDRFNIFCTPCHSRLGDGQGFIAQRGFALRRPPASYHTDRLIKMPIGHFFDVITNGYGTMLSYGSRVEPRDRWAIAAWIRVLQYSQDAKMSDVPADLQAQLQQNGTVTVNPQTGQPQTSQQPE
ncbi:MAG TPA: cytochrome c [Chthonomonadaceae bacterium]|nr:cytochrome c [Chthonomonadaceae bacterium]